MPDASTGGGVRHEVVPAALHDERLDRLVCLATGCSRREAAQLVDEGAVTVNGSVATQRSARVSEGDSIVIDVDALVGPSAPTGDPSVPVEVVHADDDVIVVDKAPDLVVHPGAGRDHGTLVHGLLARYPEIAVVGEPERPGIVHRLDRQTSGLLVVARTARAYDSLVDQLSGRTVGRRYLAVVWGWPADDRGVVDGPIGRHHRHPQRMAVVADGRPARTRYVVERRGTLARPGGHPAEVAVVTCHLETGRTHQIRVHLAAIGHPIVGDELYGGGRPGAGFERPALHAAALAFDHPATGDRLEFEVEPPADLRALLDRVV